DRLAGLLRDADLGRRRVFLDDERAPGIGPPDIGAEIISATIAVGVARHHAESARARRELPRVLTGGHRRRRAIEHHADGLAFGTARLRAVRQGAISAGLRGVADSLPFSGAVLI